MRTRQEVIDFCLSLNDTYEDYPFHDFNWTIMRHKGNQKMFAAIYEHLGYIWVNVSLNDRQKLITSVLVLILYLFYKTFNYVRGSLRRNRVHRRCDHQCVRGRGGRILHQGRIGEHH